MLFICLLQTQNAVKKVKQLLENQPDAVSTGTGIW